MMFTALPLLRSFRRDEWSRWLDLCGRHTAFPVTAGNGVRYPLAMAEAAQLGAG